MVINLWPRATMADKERLARKISPSNGGLAGERVTIRQRGHERFGPYPARMAVGKFGHSHHECYVQPASSQLRQPIARCVLNDLHLDAWILLTVQAKERGQEAPRNQCMNTDAKVASLSTRQHPCSPDRVVELVQGGSNTFDNVPARLGQAHAARMALEQEDTKVFLQRLYARAHT